MNTCSICSNLAPHESVREPETLPKAAEQLEMVGSSGAISKFTAFKECPSCGALYYYIYESSPYGTGDAYIHLTRLNSEQIELIEPFLKSGGEGIGRFGFYVDRAGHDYVKALLFALSDDEDEATARNAYASLEHFIAQGKGNAEKILDIVNNHPGDSMIIGGFIFKNDPLVKKIITLAQS